MIQIELIMILTPSYAQMLNGSKLQFGRAAIYILMLVTVLSCHRNDVIVIDNVFIIDAKNQEPEQVSIFMEGNIIIDIRESGDMGPYDPSRVINGAGGYVIPGLWDMHVHLTFDPNIEPAMSDLFLANGITSIRDTGGLLDKMKPHKERSIQDPSSNPRLFMAGPLIDGEPNVYDGSENRPEISVGHETLKDIEVSISQLVDGGVDLLKAYEMLTPDQFDKVLEQAREYDLPVTGHVPLSMTVEQASGMGLRSMEHMRNLEMSCSSLSDSLLDKRKEMLLGGSELLGGVLRSNIHRAQRSIAVRTFDKDKADEVLNILSRQETWQIPTIALITGRKTEIFKDEEWISTFQYLPEPARSEWLERASLARETVRVEPNHEYADWALSMIAMLKEKKVGIMAGTDTPIGFLTPGFSLHRELEMLVEGGLDPLDALISATWLPSQYFNLEDKLGTIEKGKIADMVLLRKNPLEDISNSQSIEAVIKNGRVIDRPLLDQMLDDLSQ